MNQNNSGIPLIDLFEVCFPGFATGEEELSLVICNKKDSFEYKYAFVTGNSSKQNWLYPDADPESIYLFPLYLNDEIKTKENDVINAPGHLNLNQEIISQVAKKLSLPFTLEKEERNQENASPVCYANSEEISEDFKIDLPPQSFAPIDLLDYMYAILYSPAYNEKYQTSLEKDFPVIPYPKNQFIFWKLARLGAELRKLHLLENSTKKDQPISFPIKGNDEIKEIRFEENYEILDGDTVYNITPLYPLGRVYINKNQFFQLVPKFAWEMSFGNHQPAQSWLKKRKGTILKEEDIRNYQRIIGALTETDRIQKEIDPIFNGWSNH